MVTRTYSALFHDPAAPLSEYPEIKGYTDFPAAVTGAVKRTIRNGIKDARSRHTRISIFRMYGEDAGPTDATIVFAQVVQARDTGNGNHWQLYIDDMPVGEVTVDKKGEYSATSVDGEAISSHRTLKKAITACVKKEFPDEGRYFMIDMLDPDELPRPASGAAPVSEEDRPSRLRKIARPPVAGAGSFQQSATPPPWAPSFYPEPGAPPSYPGREQNSPNRMEEAAAKG